jgi:hypothetical protein
MKEPNMPAPVSPAPLPTVRLGPGCEVSRLMIGSNPMSGFSHWSPERDRAMNQYYTAARTLDLLRHCQALGLSSVLLRGDRLMCRLYRDFCLEGGKLTWVAQTASELADQAVHVKSLAGLGAAGIYVHGTWVDNLFHAGREAEVGELLKRVRDTGKAVGLGTHRPEVIAHAESSGWDVDFYMACFYNLAKQTKRVVAVQGLAPKEDFDPADPPRMTATIRALKKPCLAFKVLGAGRSCGSPEAVRAAFEYAYANIKPTDAVVIGVFQGEGDQLAADVAMVRRIFSIAD